MQSNKYFFYLEYKDKIEDFILYDLEECIIYNIYSSFSDSHVKFIISNVDRPDDYEDYLRSYSEEKVIPISKQKFLELKEISSSDESLMNSKRFLYKYSLEEWII